MKKFSLVNAFVEKTKSRHDRYSRAERTRVRALRLESLESRELLSVAPGYEALAAGAAFAAYESTLATRDADVLDLSDATLDNAGVFTEGATSIVVTTEIDVVDAGDDEISLREALAGAQSGDTITFASSLQGKTIALNSQLGKLTAGQSITIDASNLLDTTTSAPGLTVSGQGTTSILSLAQGVDVEISGIAFTDGYTRLGNEGGAITNVGATLSLVNCVISGSKAPNGGGVYFEGGATTFTNCVVTGNNATSNFGGGVYAQNSGTMTFVDSEITSNTAKFGGSGIYNVGATMYLDNCSISDNEGYSGGGVNSQSGAMTFTNCTLSNNSVRYYGGAVFNNGATVSLENCTICDNKAQRGAGGYFFRGETTLTNCTITNNTATDAGGGVYLTMNDATSVFNAYNTIILNNNASSSNSDVAATETAAAYANASNTLSSYANWASGANNFDYDASKPLFTDAAAKDYTLAIGSQAIDKGDNQYSTANVDLAGAPRVSVDTIDVGAYEFQKIKLDTPIDMNESDRQETSVTLSWGAVANASGYRLAWKNSGDSTYAYVDDIDATTTTYTLDNLYTGATYIWTVQALGDGVSYIDSDYAPTRSVKTLAKLAAPASPNETAKTETTITVAWGSVANASGYQLAWKSQTDSAYTYVNNIAASTTSYTLDGLDNGATYEWKVQALGDGVDFTDSNYTQTRTVKPRQILVAPANANEAAKTETTVTVAWDAVANASGYQLAWKSQTDTAYTYVDNIAASTTSYTIDGLDNGATYEWKVQAIGDGFDYADSDYTETRTVGLRQVLAAPANPNETAKTETTITVAWDAVANASSYQLAWKGLTDSAYTYVDNIDASTTSFTIDGLDNGATYEWKVQAVGDGFAFADSDYTEARTVNPLQVLAAPANPNETAKTETTVTVSWDAVANASSYQLAWKSQTDTAYTYVDNIAASTTSYTIDGLDNGATYEWKVQALGDGFDYADSDYTETRTVRLRQVLAAPANPNETAKTETTVTVAWDAVANASSYQLAWKSLTDSAYTYVDNIDASTTSYTLDGLDNGATYEWKVQAVGDGFAYADSDYTEARTVNPLQVLAAPANPNETAKTETTVTVAWDAVANASSYRLAWKNSTDSEYAYVTLDATTTSYKRTGLSNSATYDWNVQAIGDGVDYLDSDFTATRTVRPRLKLDAPTVVSYDSTSTSITFSWSAVDNASRYYVSYKLASATEWSNNVSAGTNLSYTVRGLEANAEYDLRVKAIGDGFDYATSDFSTITVAARDKETPSTVVTTTLDVVDKYDGVISLREALGYAGDGDTITFDNSLQGETIAIENGQLTVDKSVAIDASSLFDSTTGAPGVTISGRGTSRILRLEQGVDVEINGIALTNGSAASESGGAIYNSGSTLSLVNCAISDNEAYSGGAVYTHGGATTLVMCVVANNTAASESGGAFYNFDATLSLDGCLISGNEAKFGGAVFSTDGDVSLVNCTVTNNTATNYGGGVFLEGANNVFNAYNSIIVGNSSSSTQGDDVDFSDPSAGANASNTLSSYADWASGANNLVYDASLPLFTDADAGDYTLAMGSQAIDKGDNQYATTSVDLAGNPRISGASVDLGAYEFQKIRVDRPVLSVTAKSGTTISVEWAAVENAVRYSFSYKPADSTTWKNVNVGANLSYTVTGLQKNTNYDLRLKAIGDGVTYQGIYSKVLHVATDASPTPLDKPVATVDVGPTTLTVEWNAVANAEGYAVSYKLASETTWTDVDAGTELCYTIAGLDPNTEYDVRVEAIGDGVEHGNVYSDAVLATTTDMIPVLDTPVAEASAKTSKTITASWDAVANASGYRFAWKNQADAAFTFVTLDAETTSYELVKLSNGATYCWKVLALGDNVAYANSAYSELQIDQPRQTVERPVVTVEATASSLTVTWSAIANADRYSVAYRLADETEWKRFNAKTELSYTISDLEADTSYEVQVKAIGDGLDYKSVYSEVVDAKTEMESSATLGLGDELFDELGEDDLDVLAANLS